VQALEVRHIPSHGHHLGSPLYRSIEVVLARKNEMHFTSCKKFFLGTLCVIILLMAPFFKGLSPGICGENPP
jgi:hypothetical protein